MIPEREHYSGDCSYAEHQGENGRPKSTPKGKSLHGKEMLVMAEYGCVHRCGSEHQRLVPAEEVGSHGREAPGDPETESAHRQGRPDGVTVTTLTHPSPGGGANLLASARQPAVAA
jgi:hypothetical protein